MTNQEARCFITQMMKGYMKRKQNDQLVDTDNNIPRNIISTYCYYVEKPKFDFIIHQYKKEFIFNEARVEKNISVQEQLGLGAIYDFIQNFDFNTSYFDIFVTSLQLHQKLYSHCPNSSFGGTLRDTDVIMNNLNMEITTATEAKRIFNTYIGIAPQLFQILESGCIFEYINQCVILTVKLTKLQPFPDGNKRTFRALLSLLLKKLNIPPIYVEASESKEYKDALIKAMKYEQYDDIIRFYYYKICNAIMNLDINTTELIDQPKLLEISYK